MKYYIKKIISLLIPKIFFQLQLKHFLKKNNSNDIDARVNYYCKIDHKFSITSKAKNLNQLLKNQFLKNTQNSHFLDCYHYLKYFNSKSKIDFIYGSSKYIDSRKAKLISSTPTIVKSRNLVDDNSNSVLLKINQKKLFKFVQDNTDFENKNDLLVWRGTVTNNPTRLDLVKKFFKNKNFDIGLIDKNVSAIYKKPILSINEQLKNKFILCLEGKCISTSIFWVMNSNSVCVMPKPTCESWFMEGQLIGGVHYIEIQSDFSDLEEKIIYYQNKQDLCKEIIINANNHVSQFKDKKKEKAINLKVLEKYLELSNQIIH